jgi:hypothetical protein
MRVLSQAYLLQASLSRNPRLGLQQQLPVRMENGHALPWHMPKEQAQLYRIALCKNHYEMTCLRGNDCHFAHSLDDLRRPPNLRNVGFNFYDGARQPPLEHTLQTFDWAKRYEEAGVELPLWVLRLAWDTFVGVLDEELISLALFYASLPDDEEGAEEEEPLNDDEGPEEEEDEENLNDDEAPEEADITEEEDEHLITADDAIDEEENVDGDPGPGAASTIIARLIRYSDRLPLQQMGTIPKPMPKAKPLSARAGMVYSKVMNKIQKAKR